MAMKTLLLVFGLFLLMAHAQEDKWHLLHSDAAPLYSDGPNANPQGRRNCAIWCTNDEEIYIFGGKGDGVRFNDMWRYEESTDRWIWMPNGPKAISGMIYWTSKSGEEFWIYGGRDDAGVVYEDLWKYTKSTREWKKQTLGQGSPSPGPRYGSAYWYRPSSSSLYLYGGKTITNSSVAIEEDLWSLDIRTLQWTLLKSTNEPGALAYADGSFSPGTGKAFILGGQQKGGQLASDVFWSLNIETIEWTFVNKKGPNRRKDATMWIDPTHEALFIFGGKTLDKTLNDMWRYDIKLEVWTQIHVDENTPAPRWGTSECTDDEGFAFLFGGTTLDNGHFYNDVWKYGQVFSRISEIFKGLDRLTAAAMLGAAMSSMVFVVIFSVLTIFGIVLCCKKRRQQKIQLL